MSEEKPKPSAAAVAASRVLASIGAAMLFEVPVLLGLAAIAYGAWLWFHPAGFIVGGVELLLYRVLMVYGDLIEAAQKKGKAASE